MLRTIAALAAAAALLTGPVSAQDSPAQHLLLSLQEMTGVPGMSAAVSKDGEIIWTGTAGAMDVENSVSVDDATQFRIASVSKLFAAALVLKLAEDGVLDLDADIRTYVPEWPDHDGAVVTLRHLAAHTAGVSHYGSGDHYDPQTEYNSLTDSLSVYAHKPLLFQPGASYSYSSYGYALMGAAIESVTGRSFEDNLETLLLQPLGLESTEVEHVDAPPAAASKLYSSSGAEIGRNDQSYVVGATGILSTTTDLVRFADAYRAGDIVSPETMEMSWTPVRLEDGGAAGETRFSAGFGWRVGTDWDGARVAHHAGTTPGARSTLSINRDRGTSVAFLSNSQWVSRIETTGELIATAATEGDDLTEAHCPVGAWDYDGVFIVDADNPPPDDNASGILRVDYTKGVCRGEIEPQGAIAEWLRERGARAETIKMVLVAVRPNDEQVFAAATPWGAFPFRRSNDDFTGDIAGRALELKLSARL